MPSCRECKRLQREYNEADTIFLAVAREQLHAVDSAAEERYRKSDKLRQAARQPSLRTRKRTGEKESSQLETFQNTPLMARREGKFGRKQEEAIAALLSQPTVEQAARAVNIGTRTLLRWLQLPEFKAAYHKARREAFGQATARLQQASGAAVMTLLKIMIDTNAPASTRVRAADSVLDHAAKAIEIEDIEARVAALEQASSKNGGTR
jgi:hypothetical protein